MSFQALRLYNYLKKHTDGLTEVRQDDSQWAQVCSADIKLSDIAPNQVGGLLSALQRAGLYRNVDKYFGMVRV